MSDDGPTPIRVTFNGITYRSALEADWAATFTALEIYFEYEPQPWRLPSGAVYDCDFYLPSMRTYCEAKGPHNERLWKPREFAAVLAANEYPRAYQVLILRPAGPRGEAVWEPADPAAWVPWLIDCPVCRNWAFTDCDQDESSVRYCRRCGADNVGDGVRLSGSINTGEFTDRDNPWDLPMRHAPRWVNV